ncbi:MULTISPECIES: M23 family metallopeptidase [Pseudanabaena]|uniref:Peptidase M23 n=2 Tax=Pseudanabaena TaxID=1152 RepID=L8MZ53_9CYAN|nr:MULTISPECIES: M23 family metallopeptidase [Pseudanabaena]ELS31258.1 Peptidase M23 [Pseudanabaena biceps PCC 7429]MDG3496480.1 M23 family metallopeptidase [Pseudanabaena catenata USMAC16]
MKPSWKFSLLSATIASMIASTIATLVPPSAIATSTSPNTPVDQTNAKEAEELCGKPTLDYLTQHKVKQGETLEAIAKKYELKVATLMGLNPEVRNGEVSAGQILSIPPLDGLTYRFKNDENYTTVAKKYNIRADVLFERNGCQRKPQVVFVPGALWKPDPVPFNAAIASKGSGNPDVIFQTGGYPLPYGVPVTSPYGWRMNPVTAFWSFHSGIDLGAPYGTPVLAAKAGRVDYAGWGDGYGNLVELDHGSTGTRYAHLAAIYVSQGQNVAQGQQLGIVGSTGRSTGPHLHFEIMVPSGDGWVALDPAPYLNRIAAAITNLPLL